jgi:hypothetical protein
LHCYTTIGEYFGKDSDAAEFEIIYDAKDGARHLREKEFASNTQTIKRMNHGTNTKNLPTEGLALPVGNKDGLDKVAAHQHTDKVAAHQHTDKVAAHQHTDKVAAHQHTDKSLQNVKRKSSAGSKLLPKLDVK